MKTKPRVLLIDDEAQIRSVFDSYFEDFDDFFFASAASAEEALTDLENNPADVCIVDMRLPGMDGAAFIAKARRCCRGFVVHTGSVDLELHQKLLDMGIDNEDCLLKPCDMSKILQRIRKHI